MSSILATSRNISSTTTHTPPAPPSILSQDEVDAERQQQQGEEDMFDDGSLNSLAARELSLQPEDFIRHTDQYHHDYLNNSAGDSSDDEHDGDDINDDGSTSSSLLFTPVIRTIGHNVEEEIEDHRENKNAGVCDEFVKSTETVSSGFLPEAVTLVESHLTNSSQSECATATAFTTTATRTSLMTTTCCEETPPLESEKKPMTHNKDEASTTRSDDNSSPRTPASIATTARTTSIIGSFDPTSPPSAFDSENSRHSTATSEETFSSSTEGPAVFSSSIEKMKDLEESNQREGTTATSHSVPTISTVATKKHGTNNRKKNYFKISVTYMGPKRNKNSHLPFPLTPRSDLCIPQQEAKVREELIRRRTIWLKLNNRTQLSLMWDMVESPFAKALLPPSPPLQPTSAPPQHTSFSPHSGSKSIAAAAVSLSPLVTRDGVPITTDGEGAESMFVLRRKEVESETDEVGTNCCRQGSTATLPSSYSKRITPSLEQKVEFRILRSLTCISEAARHHYIKFQGACGPLPGQPSSSTTTTPFDSECDSSTDTDEEEVIDGKTWGVKKGGASTKKYLTPLTQEARSFASEQNNKKKKKKLQRQKKNQYSSNLAALRNENRSRVALLKRKKLLQMFFNSLVVRHVQPLANAWHQFCCLRKQSSRDHQEVFPTGADGIVLKQKPKRLFFKIPPPNVKAQTLGIFARQAGTQRFHCEKLTDSSVAGHSCSELASYRFFRSTPFDYNELMTTITSFVTVPPPGGEPYHHHPNTALKLKLCKLPFGPRCCLPAKGEPLIPPPSAPKIHPNSAAVTTTSAAEKQKDCLRQTSEAVGLSTPPAQRRSSTSSSNSNSTATPSPPMTPPPEESSSSSGSGGSAQRQSRAVLKPLTEEEKKKNQNKTTVAGGANPRTAQDNGRGETSSSYRVASSHQVRRASLEKQNSSGRPGSTPSSSSSSASSLSLSSEASVAKITPKTISASIRTGFGKSMFSTATPEGEEEDCCRSSDHPVDGGSSSDSPRVLYAKPRQQQLLLNNHNRVVTLRTTVQATRLQQDQQPHQGGGRDSSKYPSSITTTTSSPRTPMTTTTSYSSIDTEMLVSSASKTYPGGGVHGCSSSSSATGSGLIPRSTMSTLGYRGGVKGNTTSDTLPPPPLHRRSSSDGSANRKRSDHHQQQQQRLVSQATIMATSDGGVVNSGAGTNSNNNSIGGATGHQALLASLRATKKKSPMKK